MKPFEWCEAPAADFAVIGDPVSHSRSPQMHNAAFKELGLDFKYVAVHVLPGEVKEALSHLAELGYQGINVTVPHKEEAIGWCLHVDRFVTEVQAVNTIDLERHAGINTDANGFLATLPDVPGKSALVLGAGGSARALARALVREGWTVRIHNRTAEKATALAAAVGAQTADQPDPTGANLILNTTSASLGGEELPVLWDKADSGALAYDLAYGGELTPFLKAAAARGLATMDGLAMLVQQGALSLEWWIGANAPIETMMKAAMVPPSEAE